VNQKRTARHIRLGLVLALVLALGALAGCSSSKTAPTATTSSAQKAFAVAISSLSTTAPDGKLLVAQTAEAVTPTSTPSWEFLIGSPKTSLIYAVLVKDGKAQSSEYGDAGLSAAEWTAVPAPSAWKVDSAEAHDKAVAVYPNGKTAEYFMGFVTYVPKSATSPSAKPMTWIVSFNPTSRGTAATSTVNVDMGTGAASLAK